MATNILICLALIAAVFLAAFRGGGGCADTGGADCDSSGDAGGCDGGDGGGGE